MATIRLFVFDLDGTLVDSRRDIAESANAVLAECGYPPHTEDAIAGMVGDGAALLIARAFAAAGAPAPDDALARFLRVYDARLLQHTRAYDGVHGLLDALRDRATLAVLTNKPLGATRTILEGLRLDAYFEERVLGGDGPQPRKPDPSGLLRLIAEADVTPGETMMVGDSSIDFRTARAAGTPVCLARYGFGLHDVDLTALAATDLVIDEPLQLLRSL
ncbi:MAG: HAD-IA family hydrolase [Acidobacteria bacterium]|nr:HAD-IA family hydrolase [Acidobacteriota bacterium]